MTELRDTACATLVLSTTELHPHPNSLGIFPLKVKRQARHEDTFMACNPSIPKTEAGQSQVQGHTQ